MEALELVQPKDLTASEIAVRLGATWLPTEIVEQFMTDDEATIVMVDSNLQREQILPSEKAFAYKMKLDAMKRQGQRTDLTCEPLAHKLSGKKSRDILAEQVGESKDQIRRYIRLTHLIPEILDLVDNSVLKEKDILQIALRPAVELSYLSEEEQQDLVETMESEDCTPSHARAIKMRQFSQEGSWTPMCCCPSCRRKSLIRWSNSKCPRSVYAHAFLRTYSSALLSTICQHFPSESAQCTISMQTGAGKNITYVLFLSQLIVSII